ncbi:MAG: amidohydrolase [bacterium]|nr:amidohydrolase [bacterium]
MNTFESSLNANERQDLIDLRRDLHRHPELAFEETRTARVVAERLQAIGLEPRTGVGVTGVSTVIGNRCDGPTVMLRADMDALAVSEVPGRPYGSRYEGLMHACGHDAHTATLLTACSLLQREADTLPGRVLAVFQPAEEGRGGANAMIGDGLLDDITPDAAFGLHYWSGFESGLVAVTPGPVMGAVDEFHLTIKGRGGHGAIPHTAVDAVVAGAAVVGALQTIVSRRSDPLGAVVCTVGEFHAGTGFNIIAGEARLSGTLRCYDQQIWEVLPGQVEEVVAGVCSAHGCEFDLDYTRVDIPLVNDHDMTMMVRSTACDLIGADNVIDFRTLGGEDMAEFLKRVPGCYFFIGAGNEEKGITAPHHNPGFDLDEDALPLGVEMLVRTAKRFLTQGQAATCPPIGTKDKA